VFARVELKLGCWFLLILARHGFMSHVLFSAFLVPIGQKIDWTLQASFLVASIYQFESLFTFENESNVSSHALHTTVCFATSLISKFTRSTSLSLFVGTSHCMTLLLTPFTIHLSLLFQHQSPPKQLCHDSLSVPSLPLKIAKAE